MPKANKPEIVLFSPIDKFELVISGIKTGAVNPMIRIAPPKYSLTLDKLGELSINY